MSDLDQWIGREERRTDQVTPGLLARWRATIEPLADSGDSAPLGLHWCLALPDAPTSGLGTDGHAPKGGFLPPVELPRRMWASSSMTFHAPIAADAVIERRSRVASIRHKQGNTGALVFVEVDHETSATGTLCISERQTMVYREAASDRLPLPATGSADTGAWPIARTRDPVETTLFRYSAITFNTHRIHYDLPYARDEECYPALVVHGPLTATWLLDLAAATLGADKVRSFTQRSVSPAFAGQKLHLVARPAENGLDLAALGDDGRTVMEARAGT